MHGVDPDRPRGRKVEMLSHRRVVGQSRRSSTGTGEAALGRSSDIRVSAAASGGYNSRTRTCDPLPSFQSPQRQRPLSLKFLTIAGNHISIPIKAVLRYPAQVFFIGLVTVNVYEAIALLIAI